MTAALRVDVPQWRIARDRAEAVTVATRVGADTISLDFGGGHRGPRLDEPWQWETLDRIRAQLTIETLAVNHANDLGLFTDGGSINERCLEMVIAAADVATACGFRYLHIPSFRASTIVSQRDFTSTAAFLGRCARYVGPSVTVLTESGLTATSAIELVVAAGEPNVKVVADTGNLTDVGVDPREFVGACWSAGVLAPTIHAKTPSMRPGRPLPAVIRDIAWAAQSILLENDYRGDTCALQRDVHVVRDAAAERGGQPASLVLTQLNGGDCR